MASPNKDCRDKVKFLLSNFLYSENIFVSDQMEMEDFMEGDSEEEEVRSSSRLQGKKHSSKKILKSYLVDPEFKGWLIVKDGMGFCLVCNSSLKGGKSELIRHAKTKSHVKNMNIKTSHQEIKTFMPQTEKVKRVEAAMCSFIVENDLPLNFIEPFVKFCKELPEKDIINKVQMGKQKATNVLRQGLRPYFNNELNKNLENTPFSVFIDETTDVSTKSQLAVVVSYFDVTDKETKVDVVDVVELKEYTADGIYTTLINVLNMNQVPIKNWVGFCSDTTSVMMGTKHSVSTLIKQHHPQVIIVKCSCHLIHLVASNACKMLPNSLEDLVRTVHNCLKRSPKRSEEFANFQKFFEPGVSPKKMLLPGQTRWLSLQACVKRVLECWEPLKHYWTILVFEDKTHANEQALSTLNNPLLKALMEFVEYGLSLFNEFNTLFQADAPLFGELKPQVERLLKNLCLNFMLPDYVRSTEPSLLNPHKEEHYCPLDKIYLGISASETILQITDVEDVEVQRLRTSVRYFYIEAVTQIQKRFMFSGVENNIYKDAEFLIPSNAQHLQPTSLIQIAKKFPNIKIDLSKLDSQWREQSLIPNDAADAFKYWCGIIYLKDGLGRPKFPELTKLVSIFYSLPFSNAITERLFSCLKNVKSNKRNRLDEETLSSILCVKYGVKRTKKDSEYFLNNPIPYSNVKSNATSSEAKEKRLAASSSCH